MIIKTSHFALPLCLLVAILFNTGCQNRGKRVNSSTENIAEQSNQSQKLGDTVATKIAEVPEDADDIVLDIVSSKNIVGELLGDNMHIRLDAIELYIASNGYIWRYDDTLHYSIPKVVAIAPEYNAVADSINKHIMKSLKYDPNSAPPIDIRQGFASNYEYEFQSHYLLLYCITYHYDPYSDGTNCESLLFDLETGECIEQHNIPFSALFSIKGYFDFLNSRNWSDSVRKVFEEKYIEKNEDDEDPMDEKRLQEKIEEEYNYAKFHIDYYCGKEFSFKREHNYYSVMDTARRYEPIYNDRLPLKDLEPYLSEVGKQMLNENNFTHSNIDRIFFENMLWSQIEDYMFFELNDADNSCISVNYQDRQNVWGYLYGKDKVGIDVKGVYEDGILTLKAANDSVYTIDINAYKGYPSSREQIVGYSDKNEPY